MCENIKNSIDWRISITPIISSAVLSFHDIDWFDIDIEEAEKEAENKIDLMLSQLSGKFLQQRMLSRDTCLF